MLELKKMATEVKNNFDGFISRMDTAHERIRWCKDRAVETIKKEKKKEKKGKK